MEDQLLRAVRIGGALMGIAGSLACMPARAEIVGWVDSSGNVTYTNMAPPKGATVVDHIAEDPADTRPRAAQDASAQLQALNDRVRDLERQLHQAPRTPPPPPWDQAAYSAPPAPMAPVGCDSNYFDCSGWAGPAYFTLYPLYGRGAFPVRQHAGGHLHGGWRPAPGPPLRGGHRQMASGGHGRR